MRLILGCGKHALREPDTVLLDIRQFGHVDVVHDLDEVPWPFADGSFQELIAEHVVEHLESLIAFMDEAWRVLQDDGLLRAATPLAGGDVDLEWCDPTHRRCYRVHTFLNYFTPEGIEEFGYTERAWSFPVLEVRDGVLFIEARPIRP